MSSRREIAVKTMRDLRKAEQAVTEAMTPFDDWSDEKLRQIKHLMAAKNIALAVAYHSLWAYTDISLSEIMTDKEVQP
jgi:hypothetical protein